MINISNNLTRIGQNELFNMSKFVVTENFKHHTNEILPKTYGRDVATIYMDEKNNLANSEIFAVKTTNGEIVGTIRVLKWDYINPLPIQKIFGINPLLCVKDDLVNEIWHIGRFAIKKGVSDINLLKKLMVAAIKPICKHENNIAFVECDAKLLRVMTLMGIKTKVIGKSINYLGSETIPVTLSYNGLIDFYNRNKYLIEPVLN
ncbi:hypothetical protein [Flavivirga eckloniae]|uniref:Uncharacterized protein n=1 Tax=Flavivirga eckloniae TaxID=1803846 RepID=A0A2K9PT58_9FLAO|nr:hypothetical protein [Flavivirga eckloniae]AUP80251.1 hypothetical protein C1H87_16680 [Flavivirga eckloniae]